MNPALGRLLAYPDHGITERLAAAVGPDSPEIPEPARTALEEFAARARTLGVHELEELYTRTFDMNPACSLEIGWHLFGEQYERGAFLVKMRERMRKFSLPEDHELPDHLSHALDVLARMEGEDGRRFAAEALSPALGKILAGLTDQSNPYRHLLVAIDAAVSSRAAAGAGA